MYLKIIFILTNSSYPDEMQHFAALHLGLRCLSKYSLRSQMVKHPCTAKDGKAKQGSPVWQTKLNLLGWLIRDRYTVVDRTHSVFYLGIT